MTNQTTPTPCSVQIILNGDCITLAKNLSFVEALDKAMESAASGIYRPEVNIYLNDGYGHRLNIRTMESTQVWKRNHEPEDRK